MKNGYLNKAVIWLFLILLGVTGCRASPVVLPTETPQESRDAVEAAVLELGRQLDVDRGTITVISVQPAEWPDGCLGAPAEGEMCTEVITKGYAGILEVNGERYEFRTDESGSQVRFIPPAVKAVIQALGSKLGTGIENIHLVSVTQVEWENSCLGVRGIKEVCQDVLVPGYRIVLDANGDQYVYHTDQVGSNLALAEFPLPGIGDALIVWSEYDELGCQLVLIDLDQVSFGACEGTLETVPFPADIDQNMLTGFVEKYAPFEAEAAGGKLILSGEGTVIATIEEQAMIAEWVRLVKQAADMISG